MYASKCCLFDACNHLHSLENLLFLFIVAEIDDIKTQLHPTMPSCEMVRKWPLVTKCLVDALENERCP